jgi:hypothetical protein
MCLIGLNITLQVVIPTSTIWFLDSVVSNTFMSCDNTTGRSEALSSGPTIAPPMYSTYFSGTLTFCYYGVKLYFYSPYNTSRCGQGKLYLTLNAVIKSLISPIQLNRTKASKRPLSIWRYCNDNVPCEMSDTKQLTPATIQTVFFSNRRQKSRSPVHNIVWTKIK